MDKEQFTRLRVEWARGAMADGNAVGALDLLNGLPEDQRPRDLAAEIRLACARQSLAALKWGPATEHLREANRLFPTPLFQRRIDLLRKRKMLLQDDDWRTARTVTEEPKKLAVGKFMPDLVGVWACGTYYPYGGRLQPWTQLLRTIKTPRADAGNLITSTSGYFCRYLAECTPLLGEVDAVVAIPADGRRFVDRGNFSLPDELARSVEEQLAIPFLERALRKEKSVELKGKTSAERRILIGGAMSADQVELVRGRTVLIVDDIIRSGATLREASSTLRKAGVKRAYGLALSHTEAPIAD